ncbi:hypothetical protein ABW19_dt0206026 [Dactylella cylindrospora]|nr:hypothetical protein ABW19_dt0206026 [Dactylella cylindrospora]
MRRPTIRLFSSISRRLQDAKPWAPLKGPPRRKPTLESLSYVGNMLSKPTWSVTSLLPPGHPKSTSTAPPLDPKDRVTPERLHHLLRLSALPMPKSKEEEEEMLNDLHDQLHFVNAIREVDTTGVEPLVAIRDEVGEREQGGITLEDVQRAEKELEDIGPMGEVEWDPLREAKEKVGRYFVVEGEMGEGPADNDEVVVSAEEVKKVDNLETVEAAAAPKSI